MSTQPLTLPENFNPETNMIAREVDGRTFHAPIPAARLAYDLTESGTAEDIAQAEKTIQAVIECQETHIGNPHRGNFLWEKEDGAVEDLNAVQFVLFSLIPLTIQWGDRLSPALRHRLYESIRLGLEEVARIDVHYRYTNIVIKDITNSCLGGELLGDHTFSQRGYDKLEGWLEYTDRSGIPSEYNSPGYAGVALRVLKRLADLTTDHPTQARARTISARVGLSVALHMHPETRRWAGPWCRAYLGTVFNDGPPEIETFEQWVSDGTVPSWLTNVIHHRPRPLRVVETADRDDKVGISTYHGLSYDFGIATQELTTQSNRFIALQSNTCIAHFLRESDPGAVMFSRYLTNDNWIGDFRQTPSRGASVLAEEGRFHGVQDGPRAIGLYAPRAVDGWHRVHSAKAAIVWTRVDLIDEIWVNSERVEKPPVDVSSDTTIVIATGKVLTTVRPLTITDLGNASPLRLVESHGNLVFEMHNYKGPEKTFWEQAHPGSFFQGYPQCGFYIEMAERDEWDSRDFCDAVASGELKETCDPPKTYDAGSTRNWRIDYSRDSLNVGIEVDLYNWDLVNRWTTKGKADWPMLESFIARSNSKGKVYAGGATLKCPKKPAWVYGCKKQKLWVAGYHGPTPRPVTFETPEGQVTLKGMGTGTIVWDRGQVSIQATAIKGKPEVEGGEIVSLQVGD